MPFTLCFSPGVHYGKDSDDVWYGSQAVYRLTFGNFVRLPCLSCIPRGDVRLGFLHWNVGVADWD